MEDTYKYPVYFKCPSLNGEQIKKIENYFHIRRKSGGGDCGSITKINDNVYCIFFKDRDAQQGVLQKSEHVLEVAGETLTLTVRGSAEPANKSESAKLNLTSSQSPQSIPDPIPPPSGEKYELHLESYLFRYLKESPEAEKKLERDLASMACSAQLYPEEEKVLVRSLAPPGAADEVQGWKTMIDKLFDGYLCHYEMDPRKIKALLQSCSSRQTTDEVKVYSEVGMAVVVGTRSQVNAKLMEVEVRSHLSEKQTSICRLGEAKLRLLWKEIELGLRKDFPGVKVTRRDVGQLVLEGSVEEILKSRDWISEREKRMSEKIVSDKSPHFLTFLKKAYGGPGTLGDFLRVGDRVEIELRATEIRLFAFSAGTLDETAKKLDVKFKEVKIDVPNCSTVPFELCEKLKSKTNELNQVQHKAQVVFGSDSSVCLLGHTKEVDELSKTVTQFIQICPENNAQRLLGVQLDAAKQDLSHRENHLSAHHVCCQRLMSSSQPEQEPTTRRIILLGKTGAGKSNLANTIFGEELFTTDHSPNSGTSKCQAETRCVNGRSITLIDTPGFFDANRSEEDMKPEIVRCITESAPGPHAFLIVLKVEKFTEHEEAVITKICQYFSEDALKHAIIVFTHGDDLPKGKTIKEFVSQNKNLSDLVEKCGGRCHVIDNKYWKNKVQNNDRSNQFQVEDLLNTVDRMVKENNGNYYINQMLQVVEEEIQREEEQIRKSSVNMPVVEIRKQAKTKVSERFLIDMAGTATGALLGAFFGVAAMVGLVITALHNSSIFLKLLKKMPPLGGAAAAAAAGSTEVAGLVAAGVVGVTTVGLATTGGVVGGIIGHEAAQGAETPMEAAERAANAVINTGKAVINKGKDAFGLK